MTVSWKGWTKQRRLEHCCCDRMPAFSTGVVPAHQPCQQLTTTTDTNMHLCAESDRLLLGLGDQLQELGAATAPIC